MPEFSSVIAITGARGWVGRSLARRAKERGWRVRGLVRKPEPGLAEVGDEAPFLLGEDIPPPTLTGARALIHCAYDFSARSWEEIERVNVHGTAKLFTAAQAAGASRLVLISTMSAFPGCQSLYGRAKLAMEKIAADAGALILRPGLVYGDRAGGMYGSLDAQVKKSRFVPLIGGGRQVLYLVHEEDLAAAALRFCEGHGAAPREPITAAHPQPWTFREILDDIAKRAGVQRGYLPVPWQPVWLALKSAETLGLRLGFRSDSLVSLMNQDPRPDFSRGEAIGFQPRPYATAALMME
jgi:nucleoside-diphosphate-sugar epimerase